MARNVATAEMEPCRKCPELELELQQLQSELVELRSEKRQLRSLNMRLQEQLLHKLQRAGSSQTVEVPAAVQLVPRAAPAAPASGPVARSTASFIPALAADVPGGPAPSHAAPNCSFTSDGEARLIVGA
ncbi:hypothetical protein MTO96_012602 [Rhipicephalus appendiculatus]